MIWRGCSPVTLPRTPGLVDDVLGQIGALLIGHRTYHGGDAEQGAKTAKSKAYGGAWRGPQFVFTRDAPTPPPPASHS
jgi:hypothetical protein